jgi:hypothetical protein
MKTYKLDDNTYMQNIKKREIRIGEEELNCLEPIEKWFEGRRTTYRLLRSGLKDEGRYVDDCFLLFRRSEHVQLFLTYLINRQHTNIRFTSEVERDGKLPILDIDIFRSNGNVPLLFTVNLRLLVFLPTSIASFHLHTNAA